MIKKMMKKMKVNNNPVLAIKLVLDKLKILKKKESPLRTTKKNKSKNLKKNPNIKKTISLIH
jgi:hypothetical protein